MTVIVLGMLFGAAATVFAYGLRPARLSLAEVFARPHRPPAVDPAGERDGWGWAARTGRPAVPLLARLGLPTSRLRADLRVAEQDIDRHLAEKATAAVVGLLTPWSAVGLWWSATGHLSDWWAPAAAGVLLAVILFLAPDANVHREAEERRRQLRHTLAAVLDLTVIALAGGAGVQQALQQAAEGPRGWAATKLRRALATAELTRTSPWTHLGQLGDAMNVNQLSELAATLNLAGTEGAKVRISLAAKAKAMRRRRLSEAEATAQSATEKMALPIVGLFLGFLLIIGYPALAHVLFAL